MSLLKFTRNAVAGLMIAAVPVTAATAAVRPGSAIPAASSSAVAAQDGYDGMGNGWIALGAVAIIWIMAILMDDDDQDIEISRA